MLIIKAESSGAVSDSPFTVEPILRYKRIPTWFGHRLGNACSNAVT